MNIIGNLDLIDSVQDFGDSPALNGAHDVVTQVINGTTYVFVSGPFDNGIQVLSMAPNGNLTPVTSFTDNVDTGLGQVRTIKVVQVGTEFFLIANSVSEDAVTVFRIDDDGNGTDGHLVWVDTYRNFPGQNEPTDGQGLLDYPYYSDTVQIGDNTYYATASYYSDAISIYRINPNGTMTLKDSVKDADAPELFLDTASGIRFHTIRTKTFLFTSSTDGDTGISVFRVNNQGILTNVFNLDLASNVGMEEVVIMDCNGETFLFAINDNASSLQVYKVGNSGALTFQTETPNFINGSYSGLFGLEEMMVGGVPFLLVSAQNQDTLLVMSMDANNELQIVQTLSDPSFTDGIAGTTVRQLGDRVFVLVAAENNDRVTVFEIGGSEDALVGTSENDRIVGLRGDDDLLGRAGNDELQGMKGDDVLSGHRGQDTLLGGEGEDVLVGGGGNDLMEGGADGDILNGGGGKDKLSYAASSAAVQVDLLKGTATGGDAAGDIFVGFEYLRGSELRDKLYGDNLNNRIEGMSGNDTLLGRGGNDTIFGSFGYDTLNGGDGTDRLYGDNGRDLVKGGDGNDFLFGGIGRDKLEGGDGNDRIVGGSEGDTIRGDAGDDTLFGGAGADQFVFEDGLGNDVIEDFGLGGDKMDFSAIASISSMADFNAAALTLNGDTVIIVDGGDNTVTVSGITEGELTAFNFIFV